MSSGYGSTTVAAAAGTSPFTMSQWQELEHQALIYKYLIAGLAVPPDLVLPIQKSFQMLSSPFFQHSPLGYCSMFGKKVDPEPGRCRRTDGKKWRCSKEAYPDSKYCERHMHRGRSRSRKPVESHSLPSSASGLASSNSGTGAGGGTGSYQNLPLGVFGSGSGTDQTQLQLDSIPYAIPSKDYARYLQGLNKPEVGEHSSFSETSSGDRASPMYSTVGNTSWPIASTRYSPSKPDDISMLRPTDYSQHTFLNCDFDLSQPGKQQHASQNLLPFFELTSSKNSWSGQEHERVNQGPFSVPQFSISGPMVSSDFLSSSMSCKEH